MNPSVTKCIIFHKVASDTFKMSTKFLITANINSLTHLKINESGGNLAKLCKVDTGQECIRWYFLLTAANRSIFHHHVIDINDVLSKMKITT